MCFLFLLSLVYTRITLVAPFFFSSSFPAVISLTSLGRRGREYESEKQRAPGSVGLNDYFGSLNTLPPSRLWLFFVRDKDREARQTVNHNIHASAPSLLLPTLISRGVKLLHHIYTHTNICILIVPSS